MPRRKKYDTCGIDFSILPHEIRTLAQREITATVKCDLTYRDVYEMLVPRAVRDVIAAADQFLPVSVYDGQEVKLTSAVSINLSRDAVGCRVANLSGVGMKVLPAALDGIIQAVLVIHQKWSVVESTIRTLAAIPLKPADMRYYLPAIRTLSPEAQQLPEALSSREPRPLPAALLDRVREANVLLGSAPLLPDNYPRSDALTLTVRNTPYFGVPYKV